MSSPIFMKRCLELAQKGLAHVSPNPMVGCVIVHQGIVIGEGYHEKYGQSHAEVNAIKAVYNTYGEQADALLKESEVYVNLEPCAHFGKTPPCADLLVSKQVKKVFIANTDPFAKVDGKGISKLHAAGIETETGLLADEAYLLNRRFFTRIQQQRPYIILKWAQTADGYIAPEQDSQKWISGPEAKELNFNWRNQEDAILVGKRTVLIDNPNLTSRIDQAKNPLRVIIDKNLDIPTHYNIYNKQANTLIVNEKKSAIEANIKFISMEDMHFYLPQKIAYQLYLMDIQSLIVEGGISILKQFIEADLWDEIRIFESPNHWGAGKKAPHLPFFNQASSQNLITKFQSIGSDRLHTYLKINSH